MYGPKVRKQYAKLYKEAVQRLAPTFGVRIAAPQPSTPPKGK